MSSRKSKRSRKVPGYAATYLSRGTRFDISNYLQNPSMIEQLHWDKETAYVYLDKIEELREDERNAKDELELELKEISIKLEEKCDRSKKLEQETERLKSSLRERDKRIEKMLQEIYQFQMKLALSEGKLEDGSRDSFLQFAVSMIAAILLGFGVNIVTAAPNNWIAWVLIVISIILSVVAFTFVRKSQ